MSAIDEVIRHRSVPATAATGTTLVLCSTVRPLPGWIWAAWGALGVISAIQALRQSH